MLVQRLSVDIVCVKFLGLEDVLSVGDTSGTEEDTDSAILYGTLRGSVVGLRYYTGIVNNNEMVALQREPNNPYDKNAVKVNNVNGDQLKSEFDKLFEDLKEDDKSCEMEGAEAVGTLLLPHQKQALAWMVSRENSNDLPPFWEERSNFYYNILTNFAEKQRPKNVLGGILADDMGLGKTLTTIALILTNFQDGKPLPVEKITSDKCYKVRGDSPLHKVKWLRIVLDEGHTIRNPNAQQTKAALNLEGHRRWILTDNKTPEELREMLVNKMKLVLSSGSDEECAVCLESLTHPVITRCAHVFCKPCIFEVIRSEQPNAKCPLCRNELRVEQLVECPLEEEIDSNNGKKSDQDWIPSSKINALMHALIELRRDNPTAKCLVVSQFTTFLSLIENPLKESGFAFTRLDGSMAQKKRVEAIQCFQSSQAGSPTVMLLSLKAGGVGLNLTAASRVFLMDPFIVKDSVEENMLKIQNKKRKLAAGAFATKKPSASEAKQTKINEIKALIDL
ncbi:hypothetical protein llap_11172 [Limosa lapponica baueri]|uniref:Helicase-like transcription factor n=1 Tax=Limosa lapponica baueri TaxID=1758121 RepID=A0A2I0TXM3_LIMLA|nr:hypothetical protein llap_11172 [Limosa lapponica baueri]